MCPCKGEQRWPHQRRENRPVGRASRVGPSKSFFCVSFEFSFYRDVPPDQPALGRWVARHRRLWPKSSVRSMESSCDVRETWITWQHVEMSQLRERYNRHATGSELRMKVIQCLCMGCSCAKSQFSFANLPFWCVRA